MPPAEPAFDGVIGRTYDESTPSWPQPVAAPNGAPNVVFAHLGCYGSNIETPNMDRLASGGLQYTNFHTTAMCSPTRASLMTGRNHHAAGLGIVTEFATGYPATPGGSRSAQRRWPRCSARTATTPSRSASGT